MLFKICYVSNIRLSNVKSDITSDMLWHTSIILYKSSPNMCNTCNKTKATNLKL